MFDSATAYTYMTVETDQDIEVNHVIRQLEQLRITRREFEEDCDLREAGLIERLSILRQLNIPIENGFQARSGNDRLYRDKSRVH